jgi:MtrB/PioB family decaheme-associated outer membrane protein
MRRTVLLSLVTVLCLGGATVTGAQTPPPAKPTPTPTAPQTPAAAAPAAEAEVERSLFEPTAREFFLGGRFNSVAGDPARFQRYQDMRDGVLFSGGRYGVDHPQGDYSFRALADNIGWRDQRFFGNYDRPGRFTVTGLWDQIPQFYSVDTMTPYTGSGGNLVLDDATQRSIQNAQANTRAYIPLAPQFELRERRDIGEVLFKATPTTNLDVTASFNTQRHRGELPFGASFGFSNDVEVPLPYDSRANDFTLGTEWTSGKNMLRVGYQGTWFNNLDDTLIWDSPLRLDDASGAPGRGRLTLWPSNSAQTFSAAASTVLPARTRITGFLSYGLWNNDEPLQPFTINSALPEIPLPRVRTEGEAGVMSVNLNLVSRPFEEWRFSARLREYDYNNKTADTPISQYVSYDSSVNTANTGGPHKYAHNRMTFDGDATWTGLPLVALNVGYSHNNAGYDFRIFESSGEDVFRISADAVGASWLTFRTEYEYGDRSGSGLNEQRLIEIGEQPAMRHYDVADRKRNRFTALADVVANEAWAFSVSGGLGKDDFHDSYFGLQDSDFKTFSAGLDYRRPNGAGAGIMYNYERYAGLQRSRSASSGQETDPTRDWTADTTETVNYFSIFVTPPKIGRNTEARLSYDYSKAVGSYFYTTVPGGPLTPPNQLPDVFNKLQQLRFDVRHRLSNRMSANVTYLYEPFRVYDFAFDPSVVDGIVQPSSLVMGYVYRPYTAHAATVGLRVYW